MKKHIAILIFSVFLLQLVSCGVGDDDPQTSSETPSTESVEPQTEPDTDYLAQYADVDYEGAVYTFGTTSNEQYPNYIGDDLNGESVNDAQFNRDVFVESSYNVSIEYIRYENSDKIADAMRNQVTAGDHTVDCVEAEMVYVLCPLSSRGILSDLNSIAGLDLSAAWWSQNMNKELTIGDKLYATTGPIAFSYYYSPRIVAFNLRLAEQYKVGDLYAVVENGKWTLDAMYNSMQSVTHDLNGDGNMDEDDMWGASVDEYSAAGFYISAGGRQTEINTDGSLAFLYETQANYDRIEKIASIVGNGAVTQKAENLAFRSGTYNIIDKVYSFKNGNVLYLGYGAQAIAFYLRDMEDDYGILPVPKYDENQNEYITFANAHVPAYIGMPANNDRGEMNGVLLDSLGYISQRDIQPLVAGVTLKGKAARDEGSQKMIDIIYEDIYLDLNSCYNFGGSFTLLRDITMGKEENFTSKWKSIKAKAIKEANDIIKQFQEIEGQ